jgi:IMP dehydrogenase/GMP reductase
MEKRKFDFDDLLIEPADISSISSRSEIVCRYSDGYLPLFTAPMDTVVDDTNPEIFKGNRIRVIKSRTEINPGISKNFDEFKSYGIDDFEKVFLKNNVEEEEIYALIDVANGHMKRILDMVIAAKSKYGKSLRLMVGNIANPSTYGIFSEAGADLIRIGIGNGGGCLTTVQTGVGYPMASLISECYEVSLSLDEPALIVADGGFKKYSDIIKALAIGADYVMLGSILNKALESAGDTYLANIKHDGWTEPGERVNQYLEETRKSFLAGTKMFKKFRGMSTKDAQKSMGKSVLKTSEGVTRMQPVEYTLDKWVENFESYLKSAMSYSNAKDLNSFIGQAKWNLITEGSFNRFNK